MSHTPSKASHGSARKHGETSKQKLKRKREADRADGNIDGDAHAAAADSTPLSNKKRPTNIHATPSSSLSSTKKPRPSPSSNPRRPVSSRPLQLLSAGGVSEEESDDDAAILALKQKQQHQIKQTNGGTKQKEKQQHEMEQEEEQEADDDGFEVAAAPDADAVDDAASRAPPPDLSDESEDADDDSSETSDDNDSAAPAPTVPPTNPSKTTRTTAASSRPKAPSAATPSSSHVSESDSGSDSDSETSESDDEPANRSRTTAPPAATSNGMAAPKPKPIRRVLTSSSSESSDDEDEDAAAARRAKIAEAAALAKAKAEKQKRAAEKVAAARKATTSTKDSSSSTSSQSKPSLPTHSSSALTQPISRPLPGAHTGRRFTVSIALPGSIISNVQSRELRTYVAGQIARAAATFCVDEIVIFAESGKQSATPSTTAGAFDGARRSTDPDVFLARILQYLETPQYMRKMLFPRHQDLAHAGLLNPLDSPHHVRADEPVPYREGVVVNRPVASSESGGSSSEGPVQKCWVNVGLKREVLVDRSIPPGTRVTVHLSNPQDSVATGKGVLAKALHGRAVRPSTPREERGMYWGYQTRLAQSLEQVFSGCPFKGGYDLCIGTSERGRDVHDSSFHLQSFNHLLLCFGGLAGLEEHIASDESLDAQAPEQLFHAYVNCVVGQGCRTIRTEEAIPITLAAMYRHIRSNQPPQGQ